MSVAKCSHRSSLVHRRFDLWRKRNILYVEFRYFEPVGFKVFIDLGSDRLAHFLVLGREIECRDLHFPDRIGKFSDNGTLQLNVDVFGLKMSIGAGDLFYELAGIGDAETICSESAQANDAEILVAEHHRIGSAPLHVRELLRVDKVNFGFERGVEPVFPCAEF